MATTAYDIIKRPIITEQSMAETEAKKYTFEVAKDANKIEIAKAVEEIFGVKVAKVNTLNMQGKEKRTGRSPPAAGPAGRRPWSPSPRIPRPSSSSKAWCKEEKKMAIKTYKPTTPSRRHMTVSAFEGIDKKAKPERSLTENLKKNAGRNSYGRITVRHRGGGNKKKYRIIDFKRDKDGTATVINLQYDPNRSANIALIQYEDGEKRYILAPVNLKAGHKIMTGPDADILPGNCLPIANIPVGELIHCIELYPGKGAQLVRSAGEAAQLMAKENGMAQVRLPSGEVRYVREECKATIGQVGNTDWANIQIGKAGRKRHMGWRPTVRGSVMNPNDHPHGGGEGKSPVGRPGPVTPWGKPAMGYKTRKTKNRTEKFIVKHRNAK